MPIANTDQWTYVGRASHDTHKYFVEVGTGRLAIADQSGTYPHQTEDGVLYVDFSRTILPSENYWSHRGYILPLIDAKDRKTATPITPDERLWILQRWPRMQAHEPQRPGRER